MFYFVKSEKPSNFLAGEAKYGDCRITVAKRLKTGGRLKNCNEIHSEKGQGYKIFTFVYRFETQYTFFFNIVVVYRRCKLSSRSDIAEGEINVAQMTAIAKRRGLLAKMAIDLDRMVALQRAIEIELACVRRCGELQDAFTKGYITEQEFNEESELINQLTELRLGRLGIQTIRSTPGPNH